MSYNIGDIVKISVCKLYKEFGTKLSDCTIEIYKKTDMLKVQSCYGLFTFGGSLACCDGEEAEIIGIGNNRYFLKSKKEERNVIFSLARGELGFANLAVSVIVKKEEPTVSPEVLAEAKKVWAKYNATSLRR